MVAWLDNGVIINYMNRPDEVYCAYDQFLGMKYGPQEILPLLWTPSSAPSVWFLGELCMDEEN